MANWDSLVAAVRAGGAEAPALRVALLAQCILESNRGTSRLAIDHGNYAGMKWRAEMAPFATKISYGAHDGVDDYCAFASPEAFVRGYWAFIGRSVYHGWRDYATDPAGYIGFLKSRGYAGDANYVAKVTGLFPEAERLLGVSVEEPDRPARNLLRPYVGDVLSAADEPDFVSVPGVIHAWEAGVRPNGLEGAIVHYDAGRNKPKGQPDDPEWGALNTLRGAVTNGYSYATVSRTGKIYLPANMDWNRWAGHAGDSKCPATDRPRVSKYYVGFEVNSPGFVHPTADADAFVPWFNAIVDARGNVILDNKGRAKIRNATDVVYRKAELRHFAQPDGNIRPGAYVPYTAAQVSALIKVMLWLKRQYPGSFRLERVYGHDEVSPGRKVDPGGSLGAAGEAALTMPQFRAALLERWAAIIATT